MIIIRCATQQKVNLAESEEILSPGEKMSLIDKLFLYQPPANTFLLPPQLAGSCRTQSGNSTEMKFIRDDCEILTLCLKEFVIWIQDAGYTRSGWHELYDKALKGWERTGTQCDLMVQSVLQSLRDLRTELTGKRDCSLVQLWEQIHILYYKITLNSTNGKEE